MSFAISALGAIMRMWGNVMDCGVKMLSANSWKNMRISLIMKIDGIKQGDCVCYNCDCMDLMRTMPDSSVDFILSDIPYDLDLNGGGAHGDFCTRKQIQSGKNSSLYFVSQGIDYDSVFSEFERICKGVNVCVFCSNRQIGRIMTWWENKGYVATLLVWDKPNPMPLGNGCYINNLEFIVYVRSKGVTYNSLGYDLQLKTFHDQPPQAKGRIHETEKPVGLLRRLIMIHSKVGDTVFDAYAGSFSTAVACHLEKRKFIGCEILPKYFDKAMKRLGWEQRQQYLF